MKKTSSVSVHVVVNTVPSQNATKPKRHLQNATFIMPPLINIACIYVVFIIFIVIEQKLLNAHKNFDTYKSENTGDS